MNSKFPASISRLIDAFASLPGIGEKTATRLVFHLIRSPENSSKELGEAASSLKTDLKLCEKCKNITTSNLCGICEDSTRDVSKICVMEEALDVLAFEKAGVWKGVYHVLHGVLNPLDGVGPESLTISNLLNRVEGGGVEEIILAMNPSIEGEATAMYLTKQLKDIQPEGLKITRIARGLPTGSELSYADEITLAAALSGRREF
ncbi:recombination mediator RecR [Patescibacteria group bacterium]|nr:recombination mediator RecR [Patescibacteria group bacterium]